VNASETWSSGGFEGARRIRRAAVENPSSGHTCVAIRGSELDNKVHVTVHMRMFQTLAYTSIISKARSSDLRSTLVDLPRMRPWHLLSQSQQSVHTVKKHSPADHEGNGLPLASSDDGLAVHTQQRTHQRAVSGCSAVVPTGGASYKLAGAAGTPHKRSHNNNIVHELSLEAAASSTTQHS